MTLAESCNLFKEAFSKIISTDTARKWLKNDREWKKIKQGKMLYAGDRSKKIERKIKAVEILHYLGIDG